MREVGAAIRSEALVIAASITMALGGILALVTDLPAVGAVAHTLFADGDVDALDLDGAAIFACGAW